MRHRSAPSNHRRWKWLALPWLVLVTALLVAAASYADDTTPDGDGAVPVSPALNPLDFGNVCVGTQYQDTVLVAIKRNEVVPDETNNNLRVFGNSATLTVSLKAPPDDSADITEAVTDSTIVLPSDWLTTALGTMSTDTATLTVTLVASAPGPQSKNVFIRASGLNRIGSQTINRDASFKVNWTGIECPDPAIKVEKTAAADYFVAGGPVGFEYTVTNEGNVPLSNVGVTDSEFASPGPTYQTGDTNNDQKLDLTETWIFTGSYTPTFLNPTQVLDNMATATGTYGATTVDDKVGFKLRAAAVRKAVYLYWQAGGPDKVVDYDASGVNFTVDIYKRGVGLVGTETVAENDPLYLWLTLKPSTASEPGWKFVEQPKTDYPIADARGTIGFSVLADDAYLDSSFINTIDFDLSIVKTAPVFVGESGAVTFSYEVKNIGPAAVKPVVTDDQCADVKYLRGDTNNDGLIQPTEKWEFRCVDTLTWDLGWNFDTGKQLCDTNIGTVIDDERPDWTGTFYGGDATLPNRFTVTLCPWIIRKDVKEFGTGNDLSDTTPFTVTIKQGAKTIATVTIKEGDPAQFWLQPGTYQFYETVLPFYVPNFETWQMIVGVDYPDWTVVNSKWYGLSHGYYKNQGHRIGWPNLVPHTGYTEGQTLEEVFDVPNSFGLDNKTLYDALGFKGGSTLAEKAQILFRQAVAALLNESRFGSSFGDFTEAELIAEVNDALASGDGSVMTDLAGELALWNNGYVVLP